MVIHVYRKKNLTIDDREKKHFAKKAEFCVKTQVVQIKVWSNYDSLQKNGAQCGLKKIKGIDKIFSGMLEQQKGLGIYGTKKNYG